MSAPKVKIKNSSGSEIPARSFVKVTSSETLANNETVYVVGQPDATATGIFFVSGHLKIADGSIGYGYDVNFGDAWVKYSTAPTPIEEVGPADASWECDPSGTGFDAVKVDATSGLVLVRGRGNTAESSGDGGSSGGGGGLATNNCCGTIYQAGSVDLDGLEWATDYTITLAAPIGTVTVTDQGSGTWESDAIDVTCTVDESEVTDEYTVTMTATGNAPGEVIVTVALTSGGGYGGAAGCCATTEGGFAWKYVNCCIVDPLAGWSMTRDPSGFSGKECKIGGCEICVTPDPQVCCSWDTDLPEQPRYLRATLSGFTNPDDCGFVWNDTFVSRGCQGLSGLVTTLACFKSGETVTSDYTYNYGTLSGSYITTECFYSGKLTASGNFLLVCNDQALEVSNLTIRKRTVAGNDVLRIDIDWRGAVDPLRGEIPITDLNNPITVQMQNLGGNCPTSCCGNGEVKLEMIV